MKSWHVWMWLLPLLFFAATPADAISSGREIPAGMSSCSQTESSCPTDFLGPPLERAILYALPCVGEIPSCCRRRPVFQMAADWRPVAVVGEIPGGAFRRRQMSAPVPCHEFAAPPNVPIRAGPADGRDCFSVGVT